MSPRQFTTALLSLLAIGIGGTSIFYWRMAASYKARISNKLIQATKTLPYILGQSYLDKITDATSVTPAEYATIVNRLDNYRQGIGEIVYIYAYTLNQEGQVVEVVDSLPLDQRVGGQGFWAEFRSAPPRIVAMLRGTANQNSVLEAASDEFGDFLSYLEVYKNKAGKRFVLGADIQIKDYQRRLRQILVTSILITVISLVVYTLLSINIRIKSQQLVTTTLVAGGVFLAIFTNIYVEEQRQLEESLFMAARAIPEIVGDDYLIRTSKPEGVSEKEYRHRVNLLQRFARDVGVDCVQGLRRINDRVVLIMHSCTADRSNYYTVRQEVLPLFDGVGRVNLTRGNQFGYFRSVFSSQYDSQQEIVVFVADYLYSKVLWATTRVILFTLLVVMTYVLLIKVWEHYFGSIFNVLASVEKYPTGQSLFCKTALISSATIITFLVVFYLYARNVLYTNYSQLEKRELRTELSRLRKTIKEESNYIATRYGDWAAWDDAYQFVQDRNRAFSRSNLVHDTLTSLDVDLVMYLRLNRQFVGGVAVDNSLQQKIQNYLVAKPHLLTFTQPNPKRSNFGLLSLNNEIFLIATYPVIRSDLSGTPRGFFVVARRIDQQFINRIGQRKNLDIRLQHITDAKKIKSLDEVLNKLLTRDEDVIVPQSYQFTYGYTLLKDMEQQPIALVKIVKQREILATGQAVIDRTLLVGFLSFGLITLGANLLVLQRVVTLRLLRMVDSLKQQKERESLHKLSVVGNDEIAYLANTFNQLLEINERNHEKFRKIFRACPTAIIIVHCANGNILDVNPSCENLLGYRAEELIGKNIDEFGGWFFGYDISHILMEQEDNDYLRSIEVNIYDREGREINCKIFVEIVEIAGEHCLLYNILDISDIKRLNKAINRANSLLRAQQETSIDGILAVDEQGKIVSFNQRFCHMWNLTPEQLEGKIIHEVLNGSQLTYGLREAIERAYDVERGEYCDELPLPDNRVFDVRAQSISGNNKKYYGQIWYFRDITALVEIEDKLREQYQKLEAANAEIAKLNQQLVAENLRMSAELNVARQLQKMLLPRLTDLHKLLGVDVVAFMQPAEEVGGDYYDVFCLDRTVYISIGDITGHGLDSGVIMLMVQAIVTTLVELRLPPHQLIAVLNAVLLKNLDRINSDKALTFTMVSWQEGRLEIIGQHEDVLILRNNGSVERVDTFDLGFPIGLETDVSPYLQYYSTELLAGEAVIMFTDGVTEAASPTGELYGLDRLCEVALKHRRKTSQQILDRIVADIQAHIGNSKILDDITIIVFKQKCDYG
ncbi:MAG: SpoIIE family protein phosphatase [Pseudanabaenaceae cyanobacterium SKYGB_i_bin29]|nr:SpoIIE family protein phosphatase [Pseudanabaenaceae cyanobacterium SKYG29]MDW8420849.1 SpoIIE family protein phosphatase [Pseudanabaenaceae cyanobacterium SKYGB_i_bin29]